MNIKSKKIYKQIQDLKWGIKTHKHDLQNRQFDNKQLH